MATRWLSIAGMAAFGFALAACQNGGQAGQSQGASEEQAAAQGQQQEEQAQQGEPGMAGEAELDAARSGELPEETQVVAGTLEEISSQNARVSRPNAEPVEVQIGSDTQFQRAGQEIGQQELQQGSDVLVRYEWQDGQPVATLIEATEESEATQGEQQGQEWMDRPMEQPAQ